MDDAQTRSCSLAPWTSTLSASSSGRATPPPCQCPPSRLHISHRHSLLRSKLCIALSFERRGRCVHNLVVRWIVRKKARFTSMRFVYPTRIVSENERKSVLRNSIYADQSMTLVCYTGLVLEPERFPLLNLHSLVKPTRASLALGNVYSASVLNLSNDLSVALRA